jgi:hypothetical protein
MVAYIRPAWVQDLFLGKSEYGPRSLCHFSAYLLTTLPSIVRFQGEFRLPGMGRVVGERAPMCFALRRLALAMAGMSDWVVLALWQGLQRIWRFAGSFVPPRARGKIWSMSQDLPTVILDWQRPQRPLRSRKRFKRNDVGNVTRRMGESFRSLMDIAYCGRGLPSVMVISGLLGFGIPT